MTRMPYCSSLFSPVTTCISMQLLSDQFNILWNYFICLSVHHFGHVWHLFRDVEVILHVAWEIFYCDVIHIHTCLFRAGTWGAGHWWCIYCSGALSGIWRAGQLPFTFRNYITQASEWVDLHALPVGALAHSILLELAQRFKVSCWSTRLFCRSVGPFILSLRAALIFKWHDSVQMGNLAFQWDTGVITHWRKDRWMGTGKHKLLLRWNKQGGAGFLQLCGALVFELYFRARVGEFGWM